MIKDKHLIVTHTNHLPVHVKGAAKTDYVSTKTFQEISEMRTGIGGKTESFLTYEKFLDLFEQYNNVFVNIEIKGTLEPKNALPPQENPSVVEQLIKITPEKMYNRIIWSSFSTDMITELKKLKPEAKVSQLFCEFKDNEPYIFENRTDRYLQFTYENIKTLYKQISLEAVHVEISTLNDDEAFAYCLDNNIRIRTWALLERNPEKDLNAKQNIQKLLQFKEKYPSFCFNLITDYAPIVEKIVFATTYKLFQLVNCEVSITNKKASPCGRLFYW